MCVAGLNWSVSASIGQCQCQNLIFRNLFVFHFRSRIRLVTITITVYGAYINLSIRTKTIKFKSSYVSLSVSYIRSLERGGVSELSLAQADR